MKMLLDLDSTMADKELLTHERVQLSKEGTMQRVLSIHQAQAPMLTRKIRLDLQLPLSEWEVVTNLMEMLPILDLNTILGLMQ